MKMSINNYHKLLEEFKHEKYYFPREFRRYQLKEEQGCQGEGFSYQENLKTHNNSHKKSHDHKPNHNSNNNYVPHVINLTCKRKLVMFVVIHIIMHLPAPIPNNL